MHVYGMGMHQNLVILFSNSKMRENWEEGTILACVYTHIVTVSDAGTSSLCMCVYMAVNCVIKGLPNFRDGTGRDGTIPENVPT